MKQPSMPGALIGRARALDNLAEKSRNNAVLRQAIEAYIYAIDQINDGLTDEEFKMMAERCIDRQRFLGEAIVGYLANALMAIVINEY